MTETVTIDIWSDVMCPWCVIGYKQLEQALARLQGEIAAQVRWHAFELNPDMPVEGEDQARHIMRKYGRSADQSAAVRAQIEQVAERAGTSFTYSGEGEAPPAMMWNTFHAHVLLAHALAAAGPDAQTRLKLALFEAHFRLRRNVSDRAVLLDIAEEAGLDCAAADAALDDPRMADHVRAEERQAWDWNITGVPAMVVNGKYMIPGAQEPDVYVNALRRVVERSRAASAN